MESRENAGEEAFHSFRIAPADLDIEDFDAGSKGMRQSNASLGRGAEPRAPAPGGLPQPSDRPALEGMLIRKRLGRHDVGAERPQAIVQLPQPATDSPG